jgi:hypothetical protein
MPSFKSRLFSSRKPAFSLVRREKFLLSSASSLRTFASFGFQLLDFVFDVSDPAFEFFEHH